MKSKKPAPKKQSATKTREQKEKAKREADLLLHEQLQALLDSGGEKAKGAVVHFVKLFYDGAVKDGAIRPIVSGCASSFRIGSSSGFGSSFPMSPSRVT